VVRGRLPRSVSLEHLLEAQQWGEMPRKRAQRRARDVEESTKEDPAEEAEEQVDVENPESSAPEEGSVMSDDTSESSASGTSSASSRGASGAGSARSTSEDTEMKSVSTSTDSSVGREENPVVASGATERVATSVVVEPRGTGAGAEPSRPGVRGEGAGTKAEEELASIKKRLGEIGQEAAKEGDKKKLSEVLYFLTGCGPPEGETGAREEAQERTQPAEDWRSKGKRITNRDFEVLVKSVKRTVEALEEAHATQLRMAVVMNEVRKKILGEHGLGILRYVEALTHFLPAGTRKTVGLGAFGAEMLSAEPNLQEPRGIMRRIMRAEFGEHWKIRLKTQLQGMTAPLVRGEIPAWLADMRQGREAVAYVTQDLR